MVGSNGKLWEHAHPDVFVPCENPDNGTAGWFVELFRFMLVMEDRGVLWLAKGTPRAWLEHGCEIGVERAPTMYGNLTYHISSEIRANRIRAEIEVPNRKPIPMLKLRLRHPEGKRSVSASINGSSAVAEDDGETISVKSPAGTLRVEIDY